MGKFIITKKENEGYQFNLEDSNGLIILVGECYEAKLDCLKDIASVKNNSTIDTRYQRKIAKNNIYYFSLITANGDVIGTSQMYTSIFTRENGISFIKKNAPEAVIECP